MIEKFVMSLDFRNKKGMIHRQTCDYAKTQDRLSDSGRLVTKEQLTGWFGPWDTYDEARAKADLLSDFKIWDCSRCNPK